jgi:iron complex outermembrane recepter protein
MLRKLQGHSRLLQKCGISVIATAIAGLAAPAIAQEQPAPAAETDEQPGGLAEIVVTAQKRSQNLQDVPVAVSAVGAETLDNANITSAGELGKIVPSLKIFTTSGSVQPFLRGIGNPGSLVGNEGSAAVYIDGVYLVRVPPSLLQLTGIERVEVLKGPQGTLFGRNASAGLLHIVTREPSDEPVFEGNIGYGNFKTLRANVYASTGLAEGLAVDVAAMIVDQQDGWGTNTATGRDWGKENTKAVRAKLRWEIGPETTVSVTGDYTKTKNDFLAHSQYTRGPRRGYELPPFGLQPLVGFYDIEANATPVNTNENWGVSGKLEHDFGFATATSITAYRRDKGFSVFDSDFSKQDYLVADLYGRVKQFSQELQLASNPGSNIDWLLGAYYLNATSAYEPSRFTGGLFALLTGGFPAVSDTYGEAKVKSASVYGQVTVPLGEMTNITGGLRYTNDKLSGSGRGDFYLVGTAPVPGPTVTGSETFNKLTYKLSLDHKLTDDFMVYVSQSRGYKSGLYNTLPFTPTATLPETLDASELGFKSELFDRRVRLNGAVFYYDFKNAQFQQFNGPTVVVINAPGARVWGAELEGQAAVSDDFVLRFSGGYLNSKYTDFSNAQSPVLNTNTNPLLGPVGGYQVGFAPFDATGNDMVRVPKWTANIGANYNLETEVGAFNFDVNYAYSSSFAWDADNKLREPSYGVLDAQIKYTLPGDRYSIRLYGKNLTKERYYVAQVQSDSARGSSAMPGAPRTYGVDLLVKF